jgi:SAM-dependent methyltransferase
MDAVYRFNRERWEALAKSGALYSRPWLDLEGERALTRVDPRGDLGSVRDKDALCLAGGGGGQSAAFSVAGARVKVLDIAEGQLARDREAARHYGYDVVTVQGDMRDLSAFVSGNFDVVYQPYSITFMPDCREVFAEVARVLRPGGRYIVQVANPFAVGLGTSAWNGRGYEVRAFYEQGAEVACNDEDWVLPKGAQIPPIDGPHEYRQLLSTVLNGLIDLGFRLLRLREEPGHGRPDETRPGEWGHFMAVMPPWFFVLAELETAVARSSIGE